MKLSKVFRALLSFLLVLSLVLTPGFSARAEQDSLQGAVVILHTNDVHGALEGYAKVATLKKTYEAKGAEVILMDAGDFSQGSVYVNNSQGDSAVKMMNAVGYDVAVMGNHELDFTLENLKMLSEQMEFEFLCATMTGEDSHPVFDSNTVIETAAGLKIGVFGISTPESMKSNPVNIKGLQFAQDKEIVDICNDQIKALKDAGCNYIVCLGHIGIDEELVGNRSIDVISQVSGIDLFIDAHSHSTLDQEREALAEIDIASETELTSTGTKLKNIGVVIITPEEEGYNTSCQLISTEGLPEDSEVAAKSREIIDEVDELFSEVVGNTEVDLDGVRDNVRAKETNMGDLITDAMRWRLGKLEGESDAAFYNGGGIRESIPAGDITRMDMLKVLPYFDTMAVVKVKGKDILEVLEDSTFAAPVSSSAFPQVSGVEFTVDVSKPFDEGKEYPGSTFKAPASINRVTIHTVGGKEFNPEDTYTLAVTGFMANGGDTYYRFKSDEFGDDTGESIDQLTCDYIREALGGTVTAKMYASGAKRIKIVGDVPAVEPEPEVATTPEVTSEAVPGIMSEAKYTVVKNDTLWSIARRYYNDGSSYRVIFEANKDILKNLNLIYPGQVLVIPAGA